jgi:methylenetetrahydrofolate reductase (NADPH)
MLPKTFHIDLPNELANEILKCRTDEDVEKVGEEWLLHQSRDLKKNGVPVLHYYTLGRPMMVVNVVREL